jgi:hypothetical protein
MASEIPMDRVTKEVNKKLFKTPSKTPIFVIVRHLQGDLFEIISKQITHQMPHSKNLFFGKRCCVMSKRELSEDKEDPLIEAIAIKEAKLNAVYAEREKQEKEFIEPLVEQMRKEMHVPQETIEKLIDKYEEKLIRINDSASNIEMTVNLLMKNGEGPNDVLYQFERAFNKVRMEVTYMKYSHENIERARREATEEFRQRVVDAWNERHPKLPAKLITPVYCLRDNVQYVMKISVCRAAPETK